MINPDIYILVERMVDFVRQPHVYAVGIVSEEISLFIHIFQSKSIRRITGYRF